MTEVLVVVIVVAALLVVVVLVAVARRRRAERDGVESFRRQIDALSPEARRPVVDKVQELEDGVDGEPREGT